MAKKTVTERLLDKHFHRGALLLSSTMRMHCLGQKYRDVVITLIFTFCHIFSGARLLYEHVCPLVTHSVTNVFCFACIISRNNYCSTSSCYKNITMCNMFTFNAFSVCHSIGQLGVTFLFHSRIELGKKKITKYRLYSLIFFLHLSKQFQIKMYSDI